MAARIDGFFDPDTKNAVINSKLLVVGAGGIGCELLKNLVLTGFEDIHVIDLDTIDVSNLNRQFLFQMKHVGKAKSLVAKESAEILNPNCKITAYHDSITSLKYDVEFYRQFSVVANALDNMAARKHVNRMCLAADIPLVESGSAGYLGQVTVYKKKDTECYECVTRPTPKDYPTCTIRNTPSESIHCIVWAKHLFNQLFGEEDSHQDVSPDPSDQPETNEAGGDSVAATTTKDNDQLKVSTREWARNCQYNSQKLFKKLFYDDINSLLDMKHLWKDRKQPNPLVWEELPDAVAGSSLQSVPSMKDQELWSMKQCGNIFQESLVSLKKRVGDDTDSTLSWDKDDKHSLDFVVACSNLRSYCFGIEQKSPFNIKSMAGNIIPAIATTNAIIGGLIVLQLIKVLKGQLDQCRTVILNKSVTAIRNKLLAPYETAKPNPKCFVCSTATPDVNVKVNLQTIKVKTLEEKILMESLNMIAPDVFFDDGKGTILVSSDPDEDMEGIKEKTLEAMGVACGSHLQCDDFFQQFTLSLHIHACKELTDQEFEIISDISELKPKDSELPSGSGDAQPENTKDSKSDHKDEKDDISCIEYESPSKKRKLLDDDNGSLIPSKKPRVEDDLSISDDEAIIIL